MDVLKRLEQLQTERGWSHYMTAKKSGLSQSTVTNTFKRGMQPTIYSLEKLCDGFGITMAQFFAEGDLTEVPAEVQELFALYQTLDEKDRNLVLELIRTISEKTKPHK